MFGSACLIKGCNRLLLLLLLLSSSSSSSSSSPPPPPFALHTSQDQNLECCTVADLGGKICNIMQCFVNFSFNMKNSLMPYHRGLFVYICN